MQLPHVSQVAWTVMVKCAVDKSQDLEIRALPHWQPVETAKDRRDVVSPFCAREESRRMVLHSLKRLCNVLMAPC